MRLGMLAAVCLAVATGTAAVAQDDPDETAGPAAVAVERVTFASIDDAKTPLVGYLFRPANASGRTPAVVMMHGRAGAYSSAAKGVYTAATLSKRHRAWGEHWAARGYHALLVDSFGPRGFPGGFAAGTYADRPEAVNEVTIRPLDAYGALKHLRARPEIDPARIALMGWSNGGSATLATMADDKPGDMKKLGFRAAVAFYPGCGLKKRFEKNGWRGYAPVRVFMGSADEEVSPELCTKFVDRSRKLGSDIELTMYPGAEHSFDDPGAKRQKVPANARAREDAIRRATDFLAAQLGR